MIVCLLNCTYMYMYLASQSETLNAIIYLDVTFLAFHANSRLKSNETTNRMQIKIILKLNALILTAT